MDSAYHSLPAEQSIVYTFNVAHGGLGGNMNVHSICVRAVLLSFLFLGGIAGIVTVCLAPASYTLFLLILTTVVWISIPVSAYVLYASVHKDLPKELDFTPVKGEGPVRTTRETIAWAITPLSVATLSVPRALMRALSAGVEPEEVEDELGKVQITADDLDALVDEAKRRQNVESERKRRYDRWCQMMGLVHTGERYAHWCNAVDQQSSINDAP